MIPKKIGTIQVDLDGIWPYLEYYGYESDVNPDLAFETSIPRFLELFKKYEVKATFFLNGKDAEVPEKQRLVNEIISAGHEIANHTYSHRLGLRKLSKLEKLREIERGEENIIKITGRKPVGFKAPGYDIDVETMELLANRGYIYDSSIISTPVYPIIMKLNQIIFGGVKRTHGPKISWLFGNNNIYHPSSKKEWKKGNLDLLELPCSVIPIFKLPFHMTFITKLGFGYFKFGYNLISICSNYIHYEFHAMDLSDEISDKRLPRLKSLEKRKKLCEKVIKKISEDYEIVTSEELANNYLRKNGN